MRAGVVAASGALVFVACSAFDAGNAKNVEPPPVDMPDSATTQEVDQDAGADADAGCNAKTLSGVVEADTALVECGPTSYGSNEFVNIGGKGLGIFRFRFDDEVVRQIATLNVQSAVLHLTSNVHCGTPCGSGLETEAGIMQAHFTRLDWAEGVSGGTYAGCDRCRRSTTDAGKGWGGDSMWSTSTLISSPADYDALAHQAIIAAEQHEVDIAITLNGRGVQTLANDQRISFLVEMPSRGRFVVATRESTLAAPTLTIRYCE